MSQFLTLSDWKTKAAAGETLAGVGLQKQFLFDKEFDAEQKTILVISTETVDRDNDTIKATGFQLGNYLNNPVVLFAHDYKSLPVARSLKTWIDNSKLKS